MAIIYSAGATELAEHARSVNREILPPDQLISGMVKDLLSVSGRFRGGEIATLFGLEAFWDKEASELSMGERQLVAIGHELAMHESSLYLEEPFLFLDFIREKRLLELFAELERRGCAVHYSHQERKEIVLLPTGVTKGSILDELKRVRHRYPLSQDYALEVERLVLHRGERVVLVGANGSGKTTLLRLLLGAERPLYGKVKRSGKKVYVPANPALAPDTGERTFSRQKWRLLETIDETADAVYFDEPTAGLTNAQRASFLQSLCDQDRLTVIATHDNDVIRSASRVLYLVKGGIAFDGPTEEFLKRSWLF